MLRRKEKRMKTLFFFADFAFFAVQNYFDGEKS